MCLFVKERELKMKQGDLLIHGGTVIDPANNFMGKSDVLICGNKIAEVEPGEIIKAQETIEADGYLVTPGLIDNHTHIFYDGTESGLVPDLSLLPMGVTTVVDAGSTGVANCEAFMHMIVNNSQMRIFCNLLVSPTGQPTERYPENIDPQYYDRSRMKRLFHKYSGCINGLKIRLGQEVVRNLGLEPLRATIKLAKELECRVTVHTANPPGDITEIASMLRSGDVFCHCYHGKGSTIIAADGRVKSLIWEARKRGVVFDTADARVNHSYPVIQAALKDGFAPDVISTDLTQASLFGNMVFGLPVVMSKYLGLGLSLEDVVKACTAAPAELLGMKGKLGTLSAGAMADVAIFELTNKTFLLKNRLNETFATNQLLIPKLTIANGKVVFRQVDF